MKILSSHATSPTMVGRPATRIDGMTWLFVSLLVACPLLLLGPLSEASKSPLTLFSASVSSPVADTLEHLLADSVQLSRQRRMLVARISEDKGATAADLTLLDSQLQKNMDALSQRASGLPTQFSLELAALLKDWQLLRSQSSYAEIEQAARFSQHGQFIDRQLILLSEARDHGF